MEKPPLATLTEVSHPGILPMYAFGEHDRALFVSMPHVPGINLRQLVERAGYLEPFLVTTIVAQIAAALEEIHAHGLVHANLIPENVLIDERSNPPRVLLTIGDLLYPSDVDPEWTPHRYSALYLAPETWDGRPSTSRTDVHLLGALTFFLATGQDAWPLEPDGKELWQAESYVHGPPPTMERHGWARRFERAVVCAMATNPQDRFESPRELARAVADAAEGRAPRTA